MDKARAKAIAKSRMGWDEAKFSQVEARVSKHCVCHFCPTCEKKDNKAFCWISVGRNALIQQEKGCCCPQCPVYFDANLKAAFYCTRDSEYSQLEELRTGEAA